MVVSWPGMTSPDDLGGATPPPSTARPQLTMGRRLTMGSILNGLHLFIFLKMLGNVFDNFVFSFLANMKHLLLEWRRELSILYDSFCFLYIRKVSYLYPLTTMGDQLEGNASLSSYTFNDNDKFPCKNLLTDSCPTLNYITIRSHICKLKRSGFIPLSF